MTDTIQHECGIAALYHPKDGPVSDLVPFGDATQVTRLMPRMLLDLQNRGQLSAGFSSYNANRPQLLDTYKAIGLVSEALKLNHPGKVNSILDEFAGNAVIGHVRYATSGENSRSYAQPFTRRHGRRWKWFCFGLNGQLANATELRSELLKQSDYHLVRTTDTEVILHYLAREISRAATNGPPDLVEVFSRLAEKFDGAYNIVFLNAMGEMAILRDPQGFRPLSWAQEGRLFGAASESVALSNLGFQDVRPVEPGELILVSGDTVRHERIAPKRKTSHCFFEWVYFANVASTLDNRSVYLRRSALGKELAIQERALGRIPLTDNETIVVPVPDTGKAAADAMAHELGLPSVEGLMRNRYVGRTFIQGAGREERVRQKFTPLREVLEGKRVILVEDSIVRSTTLKVLLGHIREQGRAKEIHVRVACPPILGPCFYGIDMSSVEELFAPKYMDGPRPDADPRTENRDPRTGLPDFDRMAADLGADSLAYLPVEALAHCLGFKEEQLCRACLTGEYPTPAGEALYQLALRVRPGEGGRLVDRPVGTAVE